MPRSTARGALKTTISLPEDTLAALRELAKARNVSFAEVIRRAVTMDKYLNDARKDGCRILIEDPEKLIKEIVIF
ncbi:MAG TPA: CopG family transcriptional regulator [Thermoanaerobaculia bacterium]|jgi:predicted transcriptional regulator|nr:CopG family transcriptional regulator [Thermoanaerobaculia bacterium]